MIQMVTFIHFFLFIATYLSGELLANTLLFPSLMNKYLSRPAALKEPVSDKEPHMESASDNAEMKGKARIKGLLERFMLFLGLAIGIEQILTLFGALKLGTHFLNKDQKETPDEKISKDYFLIGNILSVLLAISYLLVWKALCGIFSQEHLVSSLNCNC